MGCVRAPVLQSLVVEFVDRVLGEPNVPRALATLGTVHPTRLFCAQCSRTRTRWVSRVLVIVSLPQSGLQIPIAGYKYRRMRLE